MRKPGQHSYVLLNAQQLVLRDDSALIQDFFAIMKQAAIETGQWVEKRSHTSPRPFHAAC